MPKHILTERKIQSTKPAKADVLLSDGGGLNLRILTDPNGVRRYWVFIYQKAGIRKRLSLGAYSAIGLVQARAKAEQMRESLAKGISPSPNDSATPRTFGDLFQDFTEKYLARKRKDGGQSAKDIYNSHIGPRIGGTKLLELTPRHITLVVDGVIRKGSIATAGIALGLIKQTLSWAMRMSLIAHNPSEGLIKSDFGVKVTQRERTLSIDELKALATQMAIYEKKGPRGREATLPAVPLQTQAGIWVMASTLCRVGELCGARWDHVDFKNREWVIPMENAKNAKAHTIFLSDFALAQFESLKLMASGSVWVMPIGDGNKASNPKVLGRKIRERQRPLGQNKAKGRTASSALCVGGGLWTPHDLRRTGATLMGDIGIPPHVIEKCLNHGPDNKLVKTYQRSNLAAQTKEAFGMLGDHLALALPEDSFSHLPAMDEKQ